jgi:hypothetical protein
MLRLAGTLKTVFIMIAPRAGRHLTRKGKKMMHHESSARLALAELAEGRTLEEYITLVWAQRYATPSPPASNGWPFKRIAGRVTKLKAVK